MGISHSMLRFLREDACWLRTLFRMSTKIKGLDWDEALPFYLWNIWLTRNDNLHNNTNSTIKIHIPYALAMEFKHLTTPKNRAKSKPGFVKWKAPTIGYKLNTDGSTYSTAKTRGLGGVIRDRKGKWILGFMGNLPK